MPDCCTDCRRTLRFTERGRLVGRGLCDACWRARQRFPRPRYGPAGSAPEKDARIQSAGSAPEKAARIQHAIGWLVLGLLALGCAAAIVKVFLF